MELMTTKEVGVFLQLGSTKCVISILKELGVRPMFLGTGRGKGYRWVKEEIEIALESTRIGTQKPIVLRRRVRESKKIPDLTKMSVDEFVNALDRG